jgi:hypothetical protein
VPGQNLILGDESSELWGSVAALLSWLVVRLRSWFRSRARVEAENLVLRQQLLVLNQRTGRVRPGNLDRLVLVWLYRLFPSLLDVIIVVQPETFIRWLSLVKTSSE